MATAAKLTKTLLLPLLTFFSFSIATAEVRTNSYLVSTAPLRQHTMQDVARVAERNPKFKVSFHSAFRDGFRPMMRDWGGVEYRQIKILIQNDSVNNRVTREFASALVNHKRNLMRMYNLRNYTYNKLAAMALGILGTESEFGTSLRLGLKEANQDMVVLARFLAGRGNEPTSRGLTQIKFIPEKITREYPEINPDSLINPTNAAIATLGYLAEAFESVMQRSRGDEKQRPTNRHSWTYITTENVFDYLPYVYSGQRHRLNKGPNHAEGATVVDNIYVNTMKRHMRNFYFMSR